MKVLNTFSSFSVTDVAAVKKFYGETLGLDVKDGAMGFLEIDVPGGGHVTCYPKPDHQPATFTVLNLIVFWGWEIPLGYVLAVRTGLGPRGVYLAIAIAFSTYAVLSAAVFRRGRWKAGRV